MLWKKCDQASLPPLHLNTRKQDGAEVSWGHKLVIYDFSGVSHLLPPKREGTLKTI